MVIWSAEARVGARHPLLSLSFDVDVDDDVGVDGDVDDAVENAAVQKSIWHGGRPAVQSGKMTAAASGGHWIMLVLSGNKLLKHIHVC